MVAVTEAGLNLHLLAKYVDDINMVCDMLELGSRWNDGEIVRSTENGQRRTGSTT